MKKTALFAAAALLMPMLAFSQQASRGLNMKVEKLERRGDVLRIDVETDLDGRKIRSTERWEIQPMLRSSDGRHSLELPMMVVNGNHQRRMEQRWEKLHKGPVPYNTGQTLLYENLRRGTRRAPTYSHEVPWQSWMSDSWMELNTRYFACSHVIDLHERLAKVAAPVVLPAEKPAAKRSVLPPVDANGRGKLKQTAYIEFPVNRHDIDPTVAHNSAELHRIGEILEAVRDSEMVLSGILLHGFASPEGRYSVNDRLAADRVAAIKEWVVSTYGIESGMVAVSRTAEDWDGLRSAVVESTLPDKAALLAIIDSHDDPDTKEMRLKTHASSWTRILSEIMPTLRRTEYTVEYRKK